MINRVVLVGRLTKDVELRRTPSGAAVASFTLAVDNPTFGANREKTSSFINCTAWNGAAEILGKYCRKGSQLGVDGRLQTRSYDRKDGTKAYVTEVIVENITLCGSKSTSNSSVNSSSDNDFMQPSNDESLDLSSDDIADDDLPF